MLTEFEVRQRVKAIVTSNATNDRKLRMLMRLGRMLKRQSRALKNIYMSADRNAAAQIQRLARSRTALREEVRQHAQGLRSDVRLAG